MLMLMIIMLIKNNKHNWYKIFNIIKSKKIIKKVQNQNIVKYCYYHFK